jgi:hypothetical protein
MKTKNVKPQFLIDSINRQVNQKKKIERIVDAVIQNPDAIENIIRCLKTEKSSLKFSYEKILRLVSEKSPELIYPYFDDFAGMLNSENNFIKWGAVFTIANLVSVDSENKFEKIFGKYYLPVKGPVMITASNIIKASPKIAFAKPELAEKITAEILKIQKGIYINRGEVSHECKNIVCGQAIDSFTAFLDKIKNKKAVTDFVKDQLNNSRPAVRKKAEKFLKKNKL